MENEIYKANSIYIDTWIKLNPNLKGFIYENNILKIPNGDKINLQSFLVADLLNNPYFKNNALTISANEFLKIIKLHVGSENILNDLVFQKKDKIQNGEYVKAVKISNYGNAIIITSESKIYEIKDMFANEVLIEYQYLIKNHGNYVSLIDLLKRINKEELIDKSVPSNQPLLKLTNIKFFNLINSNSALNLRDNNYIQTKSKFMFYLLLNQDLLAGNSQKLLDMYNFELNRIASLSELNTNQQYALHYYKNIIEALDNYKKEATNIHRASNGYTSLILLYPSKVTISNSLSSVIMTGIFLSILYFI